MKTNIAVDLITGIPTALALAADSAVAHIQEAAANRDTPTVVHFSNILDTITEMQTLANKLVAHTGGDASEPRVKRKYTRRNPPNQVSDQIVGAINDAGAGITKPRRGRKPNPDTVPGRRRGNRAFKAPVGTITSAKEFRPHLLAAFDQLNTATFFDAQTKMFDNMQKQGQIKSNDTRTTKGTDIPRWRACTAANRKMLIAQGIITAIDTMDGVETYALTEQGKMELYSWKNTQAKELAHAH